MSPEGSSNSNAHGVAVHVENCAKTFANGTHGLGPVTLDVARGETVVLLGPLVAARPLCCGSSPGWKHPMPAGACCSTKSM
jgi:putative spermidine/putrescine transport system ATP-binding protein